MESPPRTAEAPNSSAEPNFDPVAEDSSVRQRPASAGAAGAPKSRRKLSLIALVIAVALVGGGTWFAKSLGQESTDDAQIDAEMVAVPARTTGTVKRLAFVENQRVKAGDLLAELDDDAPRARLAQADATLEAAQAAAEAADADARVAASNAVGNKAAADASLVTASVGVASAGNQIREAEAALGAAEATRKQAESDSARAQALALDGTLPRSALEQAETALALARSNADAANARLVTLRSNVRQASSRVAEAQARASQTADVGSLVSQAQARAKSAHAQVDTAKAARELAALEVSYTKIYAPHDGVVSKKSAAEGQNVNTGQAIVQLVTPGVWVTANFKETQIAKMRVGQHVRFEVDAFPSTTIDGQVESFSAATGSKFTLLPPDNASGNFTKIVQRVPVRIRVNATPANLALRPGMSVDVHVDVKS